MCDHLPADAELRDLGEHRLRDLARPERIFLLTAPDLPADFPPLRGLDSRPNNLPAQPPLLIGRERKLAVVCDLLRGDVRLVTLAGPGGNCPSASSPPSPAPPSSSICCAGRYDACRGPDSHGSQSDARHR